MMRSAISTASRALLTTALAASAATAVITAAPSEAAAQVSIVRINGIATPVYFNDGDTFRPLGGPFRFRPARLAGFNTLESYGPTHQWGGWTYKELYVNAKQATLNARTEIWNCKADDTQKDGYGRILAICIDLGADHIRKGLAHAYNIDKPADWRFLQAQRDAIVHRRGMWAKGVPPLVLTSLHSVDERFDNENNYNRLISPLDGLSVKWKHQDKYDECQEVCHMGKGFDEKKGLEVIAALRADPTTEPLVRGYEDPYLLAMFGEYVSTDRVPQIFVREGHVPIKKKLDALRAAGAFGTLRDVKGSCMYYTTFERRYVVKPKPKCLKW